MKNLGGLWEDYGKSSDGHDEKKNDDDNHDEHEKDDGK